MVCAFLPVTESALACLVSDAQRNGRYHFRNEVGLVGGSQRTTEVDLLRWSRRRPIWGSKWSQILRGVADLVLFPGIGSRISVQPTVPIVVVRRFGLLSPFEPRASSLKSLVRISTTSTRVEMNLLFPRRIWRTVQASNGRATAIYRRWPITRPILIDSARDPVATAPLTLAASWPRRGPSWQHRHRG